MKILLVNKFHYFRGGSESYYFGLDELLCSHGHEVIHFAMQDEQNQYSPTSEFFVSNVDFNNVNGTTGKIKAVKNMFYSKEAYQKMKALLTKEYPDIVHIGLIHKQITYSILDAIKEFNIPVVQSVHDLIFVCPNYMMLVNGENCEKCVAGSKLNCIKNKCIKGSTAKSALSYIENRYIDRKHYYNKIDLFIAECEFYKNILTKDHFTTSKIINLPNFLPPSKKIVQNTNTGEYFLYFGRFSKEKGILTLIEAYKKSNVDTPLVLVGGGPEDENIRKYAQENGLSEKVKFRGYVYGDKMVSILDKAKAVIVPSEWYENCPYSVMEAMARSRVVIASRIAGLPELIEENKTGLLFTPRNADELADKLCCVDMLDASKTCQMSKETYLRAKQLFDPEAYYAKLISLYQQLIDERNRV